VTKHLPTRDDVMTPERLREVLLDPTAEATAWVPARAVAPDASPMYLRALALSQGYARRALAPGTATQYRAHWRAYLTWCALAAEDPVGDGAAEVVAAHLSSLAAGEVGVAGDLVLDGAGLPVRPPLAAATIDLRLAAISKAFGLLGLAPPGSDPYVRKVKAGIHRELGLYPQHRKAALTLPRLRAVLEAIEEPGPEALRDLAMVALRVLAGLTAGQLTRIRWDDVELLPGAVSLALPPTTRTGAPRRRLCLATDAGPMGIDALFHQLQRLGGGVGPVFVRVVDGAFASTALSDAGVTKILRRWLPDGRLSAADLAAAGEAILAPRTIDVRDRALLLTGFAGALRRSNLVGFEWRDFSLEAKGLKIFLRRSKTDQEGRGFEVYVPYGTSELTCPVTAWQRWRSAVAARVAGDPMEVARRQPVFTGVDRHGNLNVDADRGELVQLRDDSFNEVVKARCRRAGLEGDFGAHSLRAGFVTTAADNSVPLHEIAEQTGHKSVEALRVYIRRVNRWDTNPLTRFGM